MLKLHLCCGTVYLQGYVNCDHDGKLALFHSKEKEINETTLDKYFKYPLELDSSKRIRREFVIDCKMNILEKWPFEDNSISEIVMINGFEHFWYTKDIPHIVNEVKRVLVKDGEFIVDFPNIKEIVDKYYETDPFLCMELIYCNHKDMYSIHHFSYTPELFKSLWPENYIIEEKTIVKTDHPMIGMIVRKQ